MSTRVSVIVAAYNAEKYIQRCLDSILAQSFSAFEVIVIDDGSTDGTGALIDEYAIKESRINPLHQFNRGIAATRQCGWDLASGDYSIFVDADDWIEPDMLELMYNKAIQESADVVFCDYIEDNGLGTFYRKQEPKSSDSKEVLGQMLGELHGSLWNKLIRTSLYKENGIRFIPGLNNREDECVLIPILALGVKVSYVGTGLYHYDKVSNPASISNVWKTRPAKEFAMVVDCLAPYFKNDELKHVFNNRIAEFINIMTFAPARLYRENREFYCQHRKGLWKSEFSFVKKMYCALYFNGFRFLAPIRDRLVG